MRIGLVFNPFTYKLHEENLRIVQRYFGLFPPLSLTWVAAIAEKAGHTVTLIDARTLQLSKEEVCDRLREFKPDILGFMMTTYMFRETLEWIRFLKERLNVPVMVGGYNLRVYPTESVTPPEIDFGCVNSAYHTVPALLRELESGRKFADVPGLAYKDGGQILVTESQKEDFNDYPFPARHLLPNELYAEFPTERKNFTVMVTSKGCPRGCLFCEAGQTTYNPRSPEKVLAEMEECYTRYGIREIDVFDYEFIIDRKRANRIMDLMIARKLDITWACRARIDSATPELLEKMKKAGCVRIYFGIESGDEETLKTLRKGIKVPQIRKTIGVCKDLGIKALGFFLVGVPGETRESVRRLVRFAKSLDLEYVQFSKVTAKPLTPLWRDLVKETGYDYWREYILGNVEEQPLPRPWTQLTNEEIDELARWAYVKYHSRLSFLIKSVRNVKSFDEFRRKCYAFLEMLFRQEKVSKAAPDFVAFDENRRWFTSRYQKSPRLPP
jgi:anaerobic magnesium-protoporphyrin IX monomethyl ester cyclase